MDAIVPDAADRSRTHRMVFEELTHAVFTDAARAQLIRIMRDLDTAGAQAIILAAPSFRSWCETTYPICCCSTPHAYVEATVQTAPAEG